MFVISWSLCLGRPFQPNQTFVSKAGELTQVKHPSGAPLLGRLLALPTNIGLGGKRLKRTNTLAYN
jgi:hypothetical protein